MKNKAFCFVEMKRESCWYGSLFHTKKSFDWKKCPKIQRSTPFGLNKMKVFLAFNRIILNLTKKFLIIIIREAAN